ncbi:MAG: histone deacetylase family protein [Thiotrichales bacterium]|nr:histone deacetylase family protein [Thiotrichales bacterium]
MFLYLSHPECKKHDNGWGHPENAQRISAIEDRLISQRLLDFMWIEQAKPATQDDVLRVHSAHYWTVLARNQPSSGRVQIDEDTALGPDSISAALHACGAVLHGIDALLQKRVSGVFCNVRPPGHHAEVHRPMGFCLFNSIAVGAAYALAEYGLRRVAILDFDVHHGNGTETYAEQEPRVQFISSYQRGIFPFPNDQAPTQNIVKLPLEAGCDGEGFLNAWQLHAWPALRSFMPELILISAGFDAHRADPLAQLNLHEQDFALWAQALLTELPNLGNPPVLSVLEGGYDLEALALSASAYLKTMAGF